MPESAFAVRPQQGFVPQRARAAAVIGRFFSFALLETATRANPDSLLDRVEEAEGRACLLRHCNIRTRAFTLPMNLFAGPS